MAKEGGSQRTSSVAIGLVLFAAFILLMYLLG